MDPKTAAELCPRCRTIDLAGYLRDKDVPDNVDLGAFQDILTNDTCRLCQLIIQALNVHATEFWQPGKYPVEMCYLGRFTLYYSRPAIMQPTEALQGPFRKHNRMPLPKSSQPRIEVWFTATTETTPPGHYGYMVHLSTLQVLENDDASGAFCGIEPTARLVGEKLDPALVKRWMETCKSHPKCTDKKTDPWHETWAARMSFLPLLLVDVKNMRLVRSDWNARYLTLSYVWGCVKQYLCLQSNLKSLLEPGSLRDIPLSNCVRDAIDFVAALGESYLWVDTLCIVQDDVETQSKYISVMDKVYGRSLLTLVSLCGHDANAALPGVAAGSRKPREDAAVEIGSLKLVPGYLSLVRAADGSLWRSRAWTFQEEILSKRRLYFWDTHVSWQCPSSSFAENCLVELDRAQYGIRAGDGMEVDLCHDFYGYISLVRDYAKRDMTYDSDSLKAFAGIISEFQDTHRWTFASGLPERDLDHALLWRPYNGVHRLRRLSGTNHSPTWCWSAWKGDIGWTVWILLYYAGIRITLIPRVSKFFLKDDGINYHEVVRHPTARVERAVPARGRPLPWTSLHAVGEDKATPMDTLIFEADTLPVSLYTLSPPTPESTWNLSQPASACFRNAVSDRQETVWIFDSSGRHCGSMDGLALDEYNGDFTHQLDLVLLSSRKHDEITQADVDRENARRTLPVEHFSAEEYYAQFFDKTFFEIKPEWCLNLMLVRWEGNVAQRVVIGQMHFDAWRAERQVKKVVVLV